MQQENPSGATQPPSAAVFQGAHLSWPFERRGRPFVVRLVEPREYRPADHAELFNAVMTDLLSPTGGTIDGFTPAVAPFKQERFDLVTFPEAFVPAEALAKALPVFADYGPSGCIHVGLRPSDGGSHLFSLEQAQNLVSSLSGLSERADEDLIPFRTWLARQRSEQWFNVGCLFAVDADRALRICLHPKAVRSQFETHPLAERHMAEADMLTLVTLKPVDKQYMTISLQPLICSDVLKLKTDRAVGGPVTAVNRYPDCFGTSPPDHIDIVSVATCTPQSESRSKDGTTYRDWHEKFRDVFLSVASDPDYARHHFSAVVLANFQELSSSAVGGLSGVFLPVPPLYEEFPEGIGIVCWGKPKGTGGANNGWSSPDDRALSGWNNRGFIASLAPSPADDELVRIFSCTIQRLPRENSRWTTPDSLSQCEIRVGQRGTSGTVNFKRMHAHD